ncbi:MAG: TolC family protein [bacterium]
MKFKIILYLILIICFLVSFNTINLLSEDIRTAILADLIEEGLKNNPQVQAQYAQWKAAESKAKYISRYPDPRAQYSFFGETVETRVGPQEHKYGLSQTIPFPGKLSFTGFAQRNQVKIEKEQYEAVKRELIKNIKHAYYDLSWIDASISITENEKSLLKNMEQTARRKYESNRTSQQDVIKTQVEISKLIDTLYRLKQNRDSLAAMLNNLLNREISAPLESVAPVEPQEFTLSLDQLLSMGKEKRPELQAAQFLVKKAEEELIFSKLNYLPDFTLSYDYIQVGDGTTRQADDGKDAWLGTVSINLPIWFGKLSSHVKEKKELLTAKRKDSENLENRISFEIEDLFLKINTYKDIISLYRTALIPQVNQAYEASRTAYESGKAEFLNWLDAERVFLHTNLAYYKSIVDYQKSIVLMERAIGSDIPLQL